MRMRSRRRACSWPFAAFQERHRCPEPLGRRQPGVGALGTLAGPDQPFDRPSDHRPPGGERQRHPDPVSRSPAAPRPSSDARFSAAAGGCLRRAPRGSGHGRSGRGSRPAPLPAGGPRPPASTISRIASSVSSATSAHRASGTSWPITAAIARAFRVSSPSRTTRPSITWRSRVGTTIRSRAAKRPAVLDRLRAPRPPPACAGSRWRKRDCLRRAAPGRQAADPHPPEPAGTWVASSVRRALRLQPVQVESAPIGLADQRREVLGEGTPGASSSDRYVTSRSTGQCRTWGPMCRRRSRLAGSAQWRSSRMISAGRSAASAARNRRTSAKRAPGL